MIECALLNSTPSCYKKLCIISNAWLEHDRVLNSKLVSMHHMLLELETRLSTTRDKVEQMTMVINVLIPIIGFLLFVIIACGARKLVEQALGKDPEEQVENVA